MCHRDEWYKVILAATIWARAQAALRDEWRVLSNQFTQSGMNCSWFPCQSLVLLTLQNLIGCSGLCNIAANEGGDGFVFMSTFVQKTEDQLDAFREWIYLIFDYPRLDRNPNSSFSNLYI